MDSEACYANLPLVILARQKNGLERLVCFRLREWTLIAETQTDHCQLKCASAVAIVCSPAVWWSPADCTRMVRECVFYNRTIVYVTFIAAPLLVSEDLCRGGFRLCVGARQKMPRPRAQPRLPVYTRTLSTSVPVKL